MALTPDRRRDVELVLQAVLLLAVVLWIYDTHRRLELAESAARNVEALEGRLKEVEAQIGYSHDSRFQMNQKLFELRKEVDQLQRWNEVMRDHPGFSYRR